MNWLYLACVAIGVAIGLIVGWLRARKLEAFALECRANWDVALTRADNLAIVRDRYARNRDEFYGLIEGLEKERNEWKAIYERTAKGAGAAQAWLFRDLGRVVRVANEYALKLGRPPVRIDPALESVMNALEERPQEPPTAPGFGAAKRVREQQQSEEAAAIGPPTDLASGSSSA